jgi:hypothetical protein
MVFTDAKLIGVKSAAFQVWIDLKSGLHITVILVIKILVAYFVFSFYY